MSDELNAGIKIFLERCKSNPDEVTEEYGKWEGLVNAVFAYVEEGRRQSVLRGLTEEEIRTLFETLNGMYREKFASRIMGHVLRGEGEESPQREFVYAASQGKQRLQGSLPPGSWQNVAVGTSSMSVEDQLKIAMRPKARLQGSRGGE
jgi:hypothetical protein